MLGSDPLVLIIALVAILGLALGINHYFHQREEALNRRRLLTRQLQKEIADTLGALQVLKGIRCPKRIVDTLGEHSVLLIDRLRALNPESGVIEQLRSHTDLPPAAEVAALGSASAIQQAQAGIRHAIKVLHGMQRLGRVTPLSFAEYRNELVWLSTELEADAYIDQGTKFANGGKLALAMSHFKHAKTTVTKVPTKDPRKADKIRAINKMLDDSNPFKQALAEARAEQAADNRDGAPPQASSR